jgi:hypothetical protein
MLFPDALMLSIHHVDFQVDAQITMPLSFQPPFPFHAIDTKTQATKTQMPSAQNVAA